MYNKKVLIESLKKLGSAKAPTQKKDVVVGLNNPIQMSSMKQGGSSVDKQLSVKKSNIQGNGLFINEPIRKGDIIGLAHINNQATPIVGKNHNHSENNPTAVNISQGNKRYLVAAKDLPAGTEITTNYRLQPELEQPEDFMRNGGMTPQKDGYRTYSPYKNLPYIDIDTDTIDTDNIVYDLQLVANNGVTKNVQKNTGLHKIPGASVIREIPINSEKQSFKKGGGPGDRWLASLVKQGTRSNNLLTYPVKLAGERIARQSATAARTKQDIIDALFKKGYEAKYFGNTGRTLGQDATYGFGKRDLIANYFRGIDTGFEPIDYDFDSDAGLEDLINEYGPLKAYLMNSQVQHEEPISARDLMYHRFDKSKPHSEYDYPNMLIRDPNISDNWNYSFHNYDADKTKENFHKLFDLYGKEIIPFDIQPNTSKKPPLFSFDYSPVNPIDNVAGHMAFLQRTPKNEFQLTTRDSWGFFPENYDPKWNMSDKFKQRQTQLMDAFGKPFILTQNNPITFKKGGVHKTKNKNSRSYSRSLDATNKFFAENYLFEKPSSRKNKIYDPHAKYYQKGGASSPEAWGQEIKDLESQIGNPDSWTLEDYYLLQDKLNDYRNWRETTPEGQAVNDSHNEEGEYNIPLPEHLRNYTNAVMKSKLAYANEFGNPAAKRMINLPDNPYQFDNGDTGTHYMASMDNYAVPQIQDENGQLMLGDYGPESDEAIRFDSDEDANYFAEHYKDVAPGFINAKLSPEEIQEYAKGGYIIEDISVPELDKAQKGKTVKPLLISDPKEFAFRNKMYADSLSLYNQSQKLYNQFKFPKITEEKFNEIRKKDNDTPNYFFDKGQYNADKKNKIKKSFDDYIVTSTNSKIYDHPTYIKNNPDLAKYSDDIEKFSITLKNGTIKTPSTIFNNKPDFSDYNIYDPSTGTSYHYATDYLTNKPELLHVFNHKIQPIRTDYFGSDTPVLDESIDVSEESKTNNKITNQLNKKYKNYYYDTDKSDVYKKPVQPVKFVPKSNKSTKSEKILDINGNEVPTDYLKKHPPIYLSDPKDARIGLYSETGNIYVYKKPQITVNKKQVQPVQPVDNKNVSIYKDKENKITNSDVVPKGYERAGRLFNAKLDPKTGKITEKEEFIYSPLPTRLNSMSFPQVARPEQQIIPAPPYVKPVHYAGPRYGTLAGDENLNLPEGYTQEQREAARRKFAADEFTRKTLEYQQQQRGTKPVVIRRQGGELDKAQEGREQTVKDTDKDYLIRMANSPLFKERYARMVGKPIDQVGEEAEAYRQQILNNIETVKINDVGVYPDKVTKRKQSKSIEGVYYPPVEIEKEEIDEIQKNINEAPEFRRKHLQKNFDETVAKLTAPNHNLFLYGDDPWARTHELSHASVKGNINDKNVNAYSFQDLSEYPTLDKYYNSDKKYLKYFDGRKEYLTSPDEQKARVDVARKYLESKGLYDPVNENFTPQHYKNYLMELEKSNNDVPHDIDEITTPYDVETTIKMFNDFVEKEPTQNSNLVKAEQGGSTDYELGDTVDKATMERLKKLGYTFETI